MVKERRRRYTLGLRVLGILENLVNHEPCVGVLLELQEVVSTGRRDRGLKLFQSLRLTWFSVA